MSAAPRLIRVLAAMAKAAGIPAQIAAIEENGWASATFTGAIHGIAVTAKPSADGATLSILTLAEA